MILSRAAKFSPEALSSWGAKVEANGPVTVAEHNAAVCAAVLLMDCLARPEIVYARGLDETLPEVTISGGKTAKAIGWARRPKIWALRREWSLATLDESRRLYHAALGRIVRLLTADTHLQVGGPRPSAGIWTAGTTTDFVVHGCAARAVLPPQDNDTRLVHEPNRDLRGAGAVIAAARDLAARCAAFQNTQALPAASAAEQDQSTQLRAYELASEQHDEQQLAERRTMWSGALASFFSLFAR